MTIETKNIRPKFFKIRDGKIVNMEEPRHRGDLSLDELLVHMEERDNWGRPHPAGTAAWDAAWNGGRA